MRADHQPSTTPDEGDDALALVQQQLAVLQARVDQLEAERATPVTASPTAAPAAAVPPSSPAPTPTGPVAVGRRRALVGLAGAAAAGTVAALASSSPAAAADGDELILGNPNAATSPTALTVTGGPTTYGLGVIDGTVSDPPAGGAVFAHTAGAQFDTAVWALAEGAGTTGVRADSQDGIGGFFTTGSADAPALLAAGFGIGLSAAGVRGQVQMTPETPSPLTFPVEGRTGTLYMQAGQDEESFIDGTLWVCVEDGTPGTWRKVAGHNTTGALHLLAAPHRVYDSRPGGIPTAIGPKTPLPAGNVARTLDLKVASSGVPAGALGALVTVLLVNATAGAGNFTIWANDQPKPTANTLVWGGDAGRFTTLAATSLDSQARVKVDASLQTHVVLDVVGYYR
ncbi:MAG TPA: hypothetical protein VK507_24005 [Iamia sp.]|nr:hypothetical protein [Iamia sp.]